MSDPQVTIPDVTTSPTGAGESGRDYDYYLEGPWGSHSAADEGAVIAECRAERAKHAAAYGRDDRYRQINAVRVLTIYYEDESRWVGPEQDMGIEHPPMTPAEAEHDAALVAAGKARQEQFYEFLRTKFLPKQTEEPEAT